MQCWNITWSPNNSFLYIRTLNVTANCGNSAKSYLLATLAYSFLPLPFVKSMLTFTYLYKKMHVNLIYFRRENLWNWVNFLQVLERQLQMLWVDIFNSHVISRNEHIPALLPILLVLNSFSPVFSKFCETWMIGSWYRLLIHWAPRIIYTCHFDHSCVLH